MRRTALSAMAAGVVALATALPAHAQDYRWDIGINGGGSWYSNSLDEDHLGGDREARFEAGWLVGAQLTYWFGGELFGLGNVGLRANGTYTERPFEIEGADFVDDVFFDFFNGDFAFGEIEDVNLWSLTGDLLFRFDAPNERWEGTEFLPYLALGLGAKFIAPAWHNAGIFDEDFFIDGDVVFNGDADGTVFIVDDQAFLLEDDTKLMGLVGLGADIRLSPNFALRAEIGDRIWDSPIRRLGFFDVVDGDIIFFDDDSDDDVGNVIHEVYGQLGLHLLFGLEKPEEVVIAPPPAPPAPPAEEAITVCIIDPSTYEVRYVNAVFMPSTGDTLVMTNGQRVAFETAYPERAPIYVGDADWYVRGEPLTMTVRGAETQWVTYGGGRIIEPADLVFLGTVNGTPVYADADDARTLAAELEDLRDEEGDDLEDILEEHAELDDEFMELEVVYVPLSTGCVFQPLRRVEEVRKVRG